MPPLPSTRFRGSSPQFGPDAMFGQSWRSPARSQFGEVVWRFDPRAADYARGFEFHPDQVIEDQPDGSLIVRFHASGWMEMCWHLYQWGDAVEVLEPEALREMVEGYRRGDFYPVLP